MLALQHILQSGFGIIRAVNTKQEATDMKRKIVEIDETKCTGCGLCANACHEGAIAMVDGKAKLVKDDYCDGMGDCLPNAPPVRSKSSSAKRRHTTKRPCKSGRWRRCRNR